MDQPLKDFKTYLYAFYPDIEKAGPMMRAAVNMTMRYMDLRHWLTVLGFREEFHSLYDIDHVKKRGVLPLVYLSEDRGQELRFNEDYSIVYVTISARNKLHVPCLECRTRADGLRAALTEGALYVHTPCEAL